MVRNWFQVSRQSPPAGQYFKAGSDSFFCWFRLRNESLPGLLSQLLLVAVAVNPVDTIGSDAALLD
jgi:hypothetical protein